jgi:hypothetical protein
MKSPLRRLTVGGVAALAVTGSLLASVPLAHAAAYPPYEPDPQSVGTIAFYNSSGNVVTSGHTSDKPLAAYAVGSAVVRAGDTQAALFAAQPNPAKKQTSDWNTDQLSSFTAYPVSSGPAAVQTLSQGHPVVTGASGDLSLANFITEFPNTSGADANLYQLRLKTADAGGQQTTTYDVADVLVDSAAGTWTQVYPSKGKPTGTVALKGRVRVGSKVSCAPSFTGSPTFTYKWLAGGTAISGATHSSYVIAAKYYKSSLRCSVTATNAKGTTTVKSAAHTIGLGAALAVVKKPYLHRGSNRSSAKVGVAESAAHGTWSPKGTSYGYQWYRGTRKITGATHATYTPKHADAGHKLSCRVTAHRHAYANGVRRTAAVPVKG